MNFRDYQWSRNPRGLHNQGAPFPFDISHYITMQAGWAKFTTDTVEYIDAVKALAARGATPILRFYRARWSGQPAPEEWFDLCWEYIKAGCYWFELYNEPNADNEWPLDPDTGEAIALDWKNTALCIKPLMDNWLNWAERVISLGGYPAFPAMAETVVPKSATVRWLEACLKYLRQHQKNRFKKVIAKGLWCATHPYTLNHFYQEPPGGPTDEARPYNEQRGIEGGWHFEYPDDPLQQSHDPGRTVFGGTALSPYGDPNGLIACGKAFQTLLKRQFRAGPVPVVGTEGGIWPVPMAAGETKQQDARYPAYDFQSHGEATVAMYRWIAQEAPEWFWGVALWIEADYFNNPQGVAPAITRLNGEPVLYKDVPDIDTTTGRSSSASGEAQPQGTPAPVTGPGPLVSGSPDYHWLILAPGLQADWFFQAANRYWQTFRPAVLADWDLIRTLPYSKTLAVTVLARSDTIDYLNKHVRDRWPNVFYDPIVFDSLEEMQAELDRRATYLKRFGG